MRFTKEFSNLLENILFYDDTHIIAHTFIEFNWENQRLILIPEGSARNRKEKCTYAAKYLARTYNIPCTYVWNRETHLISKTGRERVRCIPQ
jgi:hypothetical protein